MTDMGNPVHEEAKKADLPCANPARPADPITENLRAAYDSILSSPIPDDMLSLIAALDETDCKGGNAQS